MKNRATLVLLVVASGFPWVHGSLNPPESELESRIHGDIVAATCRAPDPDSLDCYECGADGQIWFEEISLLHKDRWPSGTRFFVYRRRDDFGLVSAVKGVSPVLELDVFPPALNSREKELAFTAFLLWDNFGPSGGLTSTADVKWWVEELLRLHYAPDSLGTNRRLGLNIIGAQGSGHCYCQCSKPISPYRYTETRIEPEAAPMSFTRKGNLWVVKFSEFRCKEGAVYSWTLRIPVDDVSWGPGAVSVSRRDQPDGVCGGYCTWNPSLNLR